ncbi:MAG: hypothetical protein OEZ04_12720 [Nitrospinota bacterium]|nr:hypothetical protein [Nitrospinota bacterium]
MNFGESSALNQKMMTLKLIWGVITSSVVIAAGAGYFITTQGLVSPIVEGQDATLVIIAIGVFSFLMTLIGYKVSDLVFRAGTANDNESFKSMEEKMLNNFRRYQSICVVRWALHESVGIMGLVCLILAGADFLAYGAAFFAVSLFFLVTTGPSVDELKKSAK